MSHSPTLATRAASGAGLGRSSAGPVGSASARACDHDAVTTHAELTLLSAQPLTSDDVVLALDHEPDGAWRALVDDAGAHVRCVADDQRRCGDVVTPWDAALREAAAQASVVWWSLPRALSALEETAQLLSQALPSTAIVVATGRVKHMTRAQNDVLARSFGGVHASLGVGKWRALVASEPLRTQSTWPRPGRVGDLTVWAHGATFNTWRLDAGTRLLLDAWDATDPHGHGRRALDLGCGSGIIATRLARQGFAVDASDVSWAAVDSTRRTAAANGVQVDAVWRDGLAGVEGGRYDVIVTNPPFHIGAAKDSTPTLRMIEDARAALAPSGQLWCVFNSHLPYLDALRRHLGPTEIVARDRAYTVARAVRL